MKDSNMSTNEITRPRTPQAQYDYGREVGRRYIAARSIGLIECDAACDALDEEDHWQRLGFYFELERSPFALNRISEALSEPMSCRAIARAGAPDTAISEGTVVSTARSEPAQAVR
jgi:hypothetical protein